METMRREWMAAAGIQPEVPIHVAENGWPTGPERSEERQAEVIEKIIRLVWAERQRLNISRYTLSGLRDTDSARTGSENDTFRFGITRSDYSHKPAFERFRNLSRAYALA